MTALPFNAFTARDVAMAVRDIEVEIRRDYGSCLDRAVTPFMTVRQITGSAPPSRWRQLARRRWFARLHARLTREITQQVDFARRITRKHV
jgi:hypothetical protein